VQQPNICIRNNHICLVATIRPNMNMKQIFGTSLNICLACYSCRYR